VAEHGLASVTMSQLAKETGIGRATLYKYFPDVESVLAAWHERHVAAHLDRLTAVRDRAAGPGARLAAVLRAYADLVREHPGHSELAALVHHDTRAAHAEQPLHTFVRDLVAEAARAGEARDDVPPGELAHYCLHALGAAGGLPSKAAVRRLVGVTLTGLGTAGSGSPVL
jgi:AcrR family transcriptional regulator